MHQEAGKRKTARASERFFSAEILIRERFPRIGPCGPWHRGVSCPVAGPVVIWVTPDATSYYVETSSPVKSFFEHFVPAPLPLPQGSRISLEWCSLIPVDRSP